MHVAGTNHTRLPCYLKVKGHQSQTYLTGLFNLSNFGYSILCDYFRRQI